jgi:hypothetical protein
MLAAANRYTSRQAAAALGLRYRSFDGWLRRVGFEPTRGAQGTGRPREWSLMDILAAHVGHYWQRQGVHWLTVRNAMNRLKALEVGVLERSPVVTLRGEGVSTTTPDHLSSAQDREAGVAVDARACLQEIVRRLRGQEPACEACRRSA